MHLNVHVNFQKISEVIPQIPVLQWARRVISIFQVINKQFISCNKPPEREIYDNHQKTYQLQQKSRVNLTH
jgi:hypothetical protein